MVKLKLVLDSNEYIFYFDDKSDDISRLFDLHNLKISINNLIIEEAIRNIRKDSIKDFFNLLKNPKFEVIIEKISEHLIEKYRKLGLKKGDVVIAAFCDSINANYLITENRHFLKSKKFDRFKVLSLKKFFGKSKEQTRY